ncbi:hypothetical protein LXL04_025060 [Taraxacum kok-saghyz]
MHRFICAPYLFAEWRSRRPLPLRSSLYFRFFFEFQILLFVVRNKIDCDPKIKTDLILLDTLFDLTVDGRKHPLTNPEIFTLWSKFLNGSTEITGTAIEWAIASLYETEVFFWVSDSTSNFNIASCFIADSSVKGYEQRCTHIYQIPWVIKMMEIVFGKLVVVGFFSQAHNKVAYSYLYI